MTFATAARRTLSKAFPGLGALIALALGSGTAHAQVAGAQDPAGSGPIVNALGWLQGTLLGNVATAVAVMAVAAVGFGMLTGRMNWRFGATVIIGVFILFGAGAIVSGIQQVSG
ncbi:TrbC/VirB2 family protein [Novosphingobium profundi]|uniref:TrbC/VirB2 family protein n=1 Tax=Novosphingobium profundi TaxID=1774954 RepID=UPI001BDA5BF7|nr:TrbC/VirB2 family protein [Novosphingobium profundi]MBT0669383.1 TrbC/VirB2 family protein [Novosphingobium profundi]